ncbi:MAG: hypothetical protein U9Q33_07385 [Campylobacterota bacterium]|nr:hypothetical protein [Campylobacterota bacterium]
MRLFYSIIFICNIVYALDMEYTIENTNIITKTDKELIDYNRLRFNINIEDSRFENIIVKLIVDNYNFYNNNIKNNENNSDIYRGYFQYTDEKHLVSIGLQRIPFGVGHIYNPVDIFNPIDSTAIETQQREGVESFRYEYALNEDSNLDITYSKYKKALRVKGYLEVADTAIILLNDNKTNEEIIGYELEGELLDTGWELRSEGGYFHNKNNRDTIIKYLIGAQYGFENSLNITTEYYKDKNSAMDNFGIDISYTITPLLGVDFLNIINRKDNSYFNSLVFNYSISDESVLQYGFMNYDSGGNYYSVFNNNNKHFLSFSTTF